MKKIAIVLLIGIAALSLGWIGSRLIQVAAEETTTTATTSGTQTSSYYPSRFGMMGGRGTLPCHVWDADETSFEWLYLHLSDADRAIVDVQEALLFAGLDLSSMTEAEQLAAIAGIKTELVTFIEENEFAFLPIRP